MIRVLVSAGPTRERIDPVRYLSNRSTGKMGYALACAARDAGCETTLVSGPTALPRPDGMTFVAVESAAEMAGAVKAAAPDADLIIMAAAVADYRPAHPSQEKIKKGDGALTLELERTEDILATLGKNKRPGQVLVGFAAETEDLLAHAREKLERKNLDFIAANDVSRSDRGFGSGQNAITLLGRDGSALDFPLADKQELAHALLQTLLRAIR